MSKAPGTTVRVQCMRTDDHCQTCGSTDPMDVASLYDTNGETRCCGAPAVAAWCCDGEHLLDFAHVPVEDINGRVRVPVMFVSHDDSDDDSDD
jgi:hypothetical protein